MISKWLTLTLMVIVFLILCADAKRRGGGGKSRIGIKIFYKYKTNLLSVSNVGSSSNSSTESSSNPLRTILGTIFMLFTCGGGLFWKFYRCVGKEQPRQQQLYHHVSVNDRQTCTFDQLNEKNLSTNETDVRYIEISCII